MAATIGDLADSGERQRGVTSFVVGCRKGCGNADGCPGNGLSAHWSFPFFGRKKARSMAGRVGLGWWALTFRPDGEGLLHPIDANITSTVVIDVRRFLLRNAADGGLRS